MKWISVEDRLPNDSKDTPYIVAISGRVYVDYWEPAYQEFEQLNKQVTHWMELPKPPEVEE